MDEHYQPRQPIPSSGIQITRNSATGTLNIYIVSISNNLVMKTFQLDVLYQSDIRYQRDSPLVYEQIKIQKTIFQSVYFFDFLFPPSPFMAVYFTSPKT